jgi:tRNA dimethylallyltransferase
MATKHIDLPLVVIVGPTASGKSSLAIEIAQRFNGEIICADSRTVYKGMDIGTAKPSKLEQHTVPHWGLDLIDPDERFSVVDFKNYADKKIVEIKNRGRIPILVGGTGLYVDAVVFGYQFGASVNEKLKSKLQRMSINELHDYCKEYQINLPENDKNKRYVIHAIENANNKISRSVEPIYKNIIVGITTDKNILRERITKRIEQLIENGVVDEAIKLGRKYGWNSESMKSNIYPLVCEYITKGTTVDELKKRAEAADWHLAKRQMTWLKRNKFIHWGTLSEVNTYLYNQLVTTE